jgi:hypothetical protein
MYGSTKIVGKWKKPKGSLHENTRRMGGEGREGELQREKDSKPTMANLARMTKLGEGEGISIL